MESNSWIKPSEDVPRPDAVMEAGGETSPLLATAITRRITAMLPGQVLQIISRAPTAQIDVAAWCRVTGNELLSLRADGDKTWFWVRRRDEI